MERVDIAKAGGENKMPAKRQAKEGEIVSCSNLKGMQKRKFQWRGRDLNSQPRDYDALALPLSYLASGVDITMG